jgi:hypothetical protein
MVTVTDPGPPGCWPSVQPRDGRGAGAALSLSEQATGAGGVDEPGVPPVADQDPPLGVRVLGEHWSAPAGLVDAQNQHFGNGAESGTRTCSTNALCTTDQSTP